MTLGERIQISRKKKGYSQEDLANLLDISRQSVQKWETDQSLPEVAKLAKLSEILDVSLDYLIKGEDNVVEIIKEDMVQVEPTKVEMPKPIPVRTVNRNILYSFKYQSGGLLITPNNKRIDASFKIDGGTLYSRYNGFNWPFALLGIIFTPVAGILMGLFIPHKWNSQLSMSSIKGIQIYSDTIELTTCEGIFKFKPRDFSTWANFFNDFSHLLDPKLAKENELKLKKEQEAEVARTAAAAAEEARKEAERKRQLELKRKLDLMRAPRISKIQTLWNTFDNSEYVPDDKNKSHSKANYLINKIRSATNEQEADSYVEEYRTFNKQFKINHEYYARRNNKRKKIVIGTISTIVAATLAITGLTLGIKAGIRENKYKNSLKLMEDGNYQDAKTSLEFISGYKDADNKVKVCDALIYLNKAKNDDSKYNIRTGIDMVIDSGETVRLSYLSTKNILSAYSSDSYTQEITNNNYTFKDPGTYSGYSFAKWTIAKVAYKDNHSYLTLSSNWTINHYNITYRLDGGINNSNNPSSYTINDSFTLYNPTKSGYLFVGWYNASGNRVTNINKGSVGHLTLTAKWEANSYRLTVGIDDAKHGTVTGTGTYKFNDNVVITASENEGYVFEGWYRNNTKFSSSLSYSFRMPAEDIVFSGKFNIRKYTIHYILNGGVQNSGNPKEYTIETDTFELKSPTKEYSVFEGWRDEKGNLIEKIEKGTKGDLTLYANWSLMKYLLNIQIIGDSQLGSVTGIGNYTWGTKVHVEATLYGDNKFLGWYNDEDCTELLSSDLTYEFIMPKNNLTIYTRFRSSSQIDFERNQGILPKLLSEEYFTYGMYPQTIVSNEGTINSLNILSTTNNNDTVFFDGNYYKKKVAEYWNGLTSYTFSDGSSIVSGKTYWFKFEPVKWRILNNIGYYYAMTNSILDTHRFDASTNLYNNSEIKDWILNDFKNNMFSKVAYFEEAMFDRNTPLSLMSRSEFSDSRYEFSGVGYMDSMRALKMTDYALASYCNGTYWTATPREGSNSRVYYVTTKGEFNHEWAYAREKGVVVSTQIKLNSFDLF